MEIMTAQGAQRRTGVLRKADFRRLWLADALSQVGSRIDVLALPLLAATTLGASVFQVSLLRTLETLPYLLLGLQVGAWCDRMRHRPVLIAADLGRAVLIGSIPVAAWFGVLGLGQVFVVVLGLGTLGVFFDIAHPTYVPYLVAKADLPEANARLQTNRSTAAVAGPGLAGLIITAVGISGAMLVDALSYLWSAWWLRRIEAPDVRPEPPAKRHLGREIGEGLRVVMKDGILRAIGLYYALTSVFQSIQLAVVIVFLTRDLGLSPLAIGLMSTAGLTGALTAGFTARKVGERIGHGRALWGAAVLFGLAFQLYPFTGRGWGIAWYVAAGFGSSYSVIMFSVFGLSFQQTIAAPHLLGRVNSVIHTLVLGAVPIGSALGGILAGTIGMRPTMHVAAAGVLAAAVVLVFSPLRRMRDLPS